MFFSLEPASARTAVMPEPSKANSPSSVVVAGRTSSWTSFVVPLKARFLMARSNERPPSKVSVELRAREGARVDASDLLGDRDAADARPFEGLVGDHAAGVGEALDLHEVGCALQEARAIGRLQVEGLDLRYQRTAFVGMSAAPTAHQLAEQGVVGEAAARRRAAARAPASRAGAGGALEDDATLNVVHVGTDRPAHQWAPITRGRRGGAGEGRTDFVGDDPLLQKLLPRS